MFRLRRSAGPRQTTSASQNACRRRNAGTSAVPDPSLYDIALCTAIIVPAIHSGHKNRIFERIVVRIEYGLTNLIIQKEYIITIDNTNISFSPLFDFRQSKEKLKDKQWYGATCIAYLECECDDKDKMFEDICSILSLGMGSKVNWIYKKIEDLVIDTSNRVYKPYSSFNLIQIYENNQIIPFLGNVYDSFIKYKDTYNLKNVISIIIDSKLETDFLEDRAIKVTVAYELLKDGYLKSVDRLLIINKNKFTKVQHYLKKYIGENAILFDLSEEEIGIIKTTVASINHYPFKNALIDIL